MPAVIGIGRAVLLVGWCWSRGPGVERLPSSCCSSARAAISCFRLVLPACWAGGGGEGPALASLTSTAV
eukprot:13980952-Alexandrium_andersonii.AAC.1